MRYRSIGFLWLVSASAILSKQQRMVSVMQGQSTAVSVARKPAASQVAVNTSQPSVTPLLFRRVVAALEAEHAEQSIAESEHIPVRLVRRIRKYELDRRNRQMNAVGSAFGGFLDNVRHLHREIDEAIFEELREGAA